MARRKFFRRRARGRYGGGRRFIRRRGVSGGGRSMIQIDAMAYGAVRPMLAGLITPLTNMLPLGNLSDNIGLGLVDYFVAKKTGGLLGQIASKGLTIENAMIGSDLAAGFTGKTTSGTTGVMFG